MNEFQAYLLQHKKSLQNIDLSTLTKKKTLICYENKNQLIFHHIGKSRFVLKDALNLQNFKQKLANSHNKIIFHTDAPLCSKAKNYLINEGFSIL